MKLAGRIAVITGAGRGIGRAIALAFAREGALVSLCSRTGAEVERVADEIRRDTGSDVMHDVCDVSDPEDVKEFFLATYNAFHRSADILVNNAGVAESAKLAETSDELWQRHLAVNLSGTFYCMREALPSMAERAVEKIAARTGLGEAEALSVLEHMSPQNRLVTPEEVAAVALLLASDEGRGITGQAINVDGGTVLF